LRDLAYRDDVLRDELRGVGRQPAGSAHPGEGPSPKMLRIVSPAIARGSVASAVPTLSRPVISSPT
jgi:hypothetical protein